MSEDNTPTTKPNKTGQWFGGGSMIFFASIFAYTVVYGSPDNKLHQDGLWYSFMGIVGLCSVVLAGLGYRLGEQFLSAIGRKP